MFITVLGLKVRVTLFNIFAKNIFYEKKLLIEYPTVFRI